MKTFSNPGQKPDSDTVRIISWNLLHSVGAVADDIAGLIDAYAPDLMVMQEVTPPIHHLTELVGGRYVHQEWPGRKHGLAAWSCEPVPDFHPLALPASWLPGRLPTRFAQMLFFEGMAVANVHLSHGQVLNRRQLARIAKATKGPTAIIGDFNSVGTTNVPGFADVGPQVSTHRAQSLVPFRLDRCLVRELDCTQSWVLEHGPSDHQPIVLDFRRLPGTRRG